MFVRIICVWVNQRHYYFCRLKKKKTEYQQFPIIQASSNQGKSKNNGKPFFFFLKGKKEKEKHGFMGLSKSGVYKFTGMYIYTKKEKCLR